MNDILDQAALLDRVDHDIEFLAETVEMFNEDAPGLLSEIRQAVAGRHSAALATAAHTFKGMVANFCAKGSVEAALKLEMMGKSADLAQAEESLRALEVESQRLKSALEELLQDG